MLFISTTSSPVGRRQMWIAIGITFLIAVLQLVQLRLRTLAALPAFDSPRLRPIAGALSTEEQLEFAGAIEATINNDDIDAWNSLIDWQVIADEATRGTFPVSWSSATKRFQTTLLDPGNRRDENSLAGQLIAEVKKGATFKFLRLEESAGEPVVVFRIQYPHGGVNYHKFYPAKSSDGRIRAHDFYTFATAEFFSETLRRVFYQLGALQVKNGNDQFWVISDPALDQIHLEAEMRKQFQQGKFREVLEEYRTLSHAAQHEKRNLLLRLSSSEHLSPEEYEAAVEEYRRTFPTDAFVDYLAFGVDFRHDEMELALVDLERVLRILGEDGWLQTLLSTVLLKLNRFDEALAAAERALVLEPDLPDAYKAAMDVSIALKKYAQALSHRQAFEKRFSTELAIPADAPFYAEFLASPEYSAMVQTQESRDQEKPASPSVTTEADVPK